METDIDAKNPQELNEVVKTMQTKFGNIVQTYSILTILEDTICNPFGK